MLRRFSAFLLSFIFCLILFVPSALAEDYGVRWIGYVDDSSTGAFVHAPDMYAAAVYACGGNPALISDEVRSRLSDPDYGGRFYAYAQSFGHVMSVYEIPDWVPLYILAAEGISNVWHGQFGDMWLWSSKVSSSLFDGAMVDFRRVLAGDDLGGGSGGVVTGYESVSLVSGRPTWNPFIEQNWMKHKYYNAAIDSDGVVTLTGGSGYFSEFVDVTGYASSFRLYVSPSVLSYVRSVGKEFCFFVSATGDNVRAGFFYADELRISRHVASSNTRLTRDYVTGTALHRWISGNLNCYRDSDGLFCVLPYDEVVPSDVVSMDENDPGYYSSFFSPIVPPDGDWPDPETPVAPTAPELPEPVTPTVTPEPTVTEPTPTWPVIPTPTAPTVTLTGTPSGLDYTQLLTLINDNLNDINSYTVAINSNFNSLRSDLVTEFDSVVQALRNIYQYLQHLDNILERHCVHLQNKMEDVSVDIQNKMRELVHWLADQIDFDSSEDGDDELSDILSTINGKLGGGTYEPNPISNEDGYYEWLDDLWDRFLLGDDWESSVSGISSSFGQLKTRFPFSVPWDIVALFRLFVHDPVTPEFDLPLYFSPDSSTPVHVDLSAWDDVASIVRPLVYVIFALKLALLSRDLLGGLGADKGGL